MQALVYFLHTILESLDRGENYILVFFADFSKGFDFVDRNVLDSELELLGVHICLRNWIGAFLTSRPQRVTINGTVYTPVFPHGGIPRRTRLAPLLFAVLVNRLVSDWPYRVKYVDDTTVCMKSSLGAHLAIYRTLQVTFVTSRLGVVCASIPRSPSSPSSAPVSELQHMGSAIKRVHS